MKNIILIIVLFLVFEPSIGQQKEYNFINFSSKDGLASNTTNAILKDKYGFMWFGTENGLNKFDGQKITLYKHQENDSTNIGIGSVMGIVEDKNGNLWVGTNITLSMYNRSLDNFTNYDFSKYGWIRSLCADHLGNIWVGTYTGLYYFNTKTKKIKSYKAQPNDINQLNSGLILSIFEDSKYNIWVGTKVGLHLFKPQIETFQRFLHSENDPKSISDNVVRTIVEDKNGNLWIGTDIGGLNVMNPNNFTFSCFKKVENDEKKLSSNRIFKIAFDNNNKLWLGTELGVNIFDISTGQVERIKSSSFNKYNLFGGFVGYSIKDIYIDKAGIYWVSSFQSGINKYDSNLAFFNYKSYSPFDAKGLSSSSITSFTEGTSGNIYVGTDGGGLHLFDRKANTIRLISGQNSLSDKSTVLALEKKQNILWVGTYSHGLFGIDLSNNSVKYTQSIKENTNNGVLVPINCIKADKSGHLWLGTNGNGVYRFNQLTGELIPFEKLIHPKYKNKLNLNGFINCIIEDKAGNIWIGSNGNGIAVFDPVNSDIKMFNHTNSELPIDKVLTIFSDREGKIWVGVLGGGLCLFNPKTNKFQQFYENNLFSNNLIFKILEDDSGKLWLSTQKGISVFDPIKKKFKNYIHQNGIQHGTFNINAGMKTSTGEMYFGGLDGFNYFNPKNLFKNINTPPLVITGLKINNKQTNPIENSEITDHISMAKEINLSYKQNFSLDFIALNYTAPHENQYSYMLEGFDKEWINVGNTTTAVYTNLDPGTYTFKLKAQSEDGSWQTPEKAIRIIVNPPFWRTYFAYFVYLLILGISLWAIRHRGIQKLRNEFSLEQERREVKYLIERERREAERKMEVEQIKIKFLTNLSHELKTPLTLILNPIENLLNNEKNTEKLEIIDIINRNAKRLLNLVNQLLDLRKIEENEIKLNLAEGDIVSFAKEIFDSFKYISERKHISLDFESSINDYNTNFDKNKVERILINLLSNAIKFTNENGNVYCQIESDDNKGIKLIIGDSGVGIPEEMQAKIFERFFQINNSTNILNQGSGIGLSIAQEFVKLHSGTITLESEENMGSIFTVYLPFVRTTIKSADINSIEIISLENHENEVKQKETEQVSIKKPVLLIVDDSEDLRAYLRESLKSNYKIIEASDGKQGWQKTLASHPEIIVSDINMPNMDGIMLVKKIKNDIRTKHIPVVLLTVLGEEIEQLKGLETGANDYLTKPFSLKLLNIKINNLLNLNHTLKHIYSKQINLDMPAIEVVSEDEKFLLKIGRFIEEHITDSELSIEELSQKMYMSRGTLYSRILSLTGETPVEYVRSFKLKKAVELLEKSDMKISQIGYEVGFSNPNYFARAFKAKYGISPTEYINLKREPAKI